MKMLAIMATAINALARPSLIQDIRNRSDVGSASAR